MNRALILFIVLFLIATPAAAMEFSPPAAPEEAETWMPENTEDFGDGLLFVIRSALDVVQPSILEASQTCVSLVAVSFLVSIVLGFSETAKSAVEMVGTVTAGVLLFQPTNSLIRLGTETVQQISQYGKLLLPVMTGALAAQGAATKSGVLYTATTFFNTILTSAISELLVPLAYFFLCISVGFRIFHSSLLKDMGSFIKWATTWGLKTVLYIFTGYISITGVVAGTTDASILKATKLTISGMVPVVGNIISDASEAVLVSAGIMKNAVGIYGLLAVIALWIGPFLQIGIQYLMLKITAGISEMFGPKRISDLIKDFSSAMGLVLAMTGTVCLIFLISIICFMKGTN